MTEDFHVFPAAGTGAGMRKPPAAGDIASYYGKLTGFSDFCRRKLLLTTGKTPVFQIFTVATVKTPIFQISAAEAVPVRW